MTNATGSAGRRPVRILVVDDHPLIREGLAARIGAQPDMEVCGEAITVSEAIEQMKRTMPDLVIVDIQLVESHGIDLINEINHRYPTVKMLVVSAFDESLYAERALRAGAHGYINKREMQQDVIVALRTVMSGQRYLSAEMTRRLVSSAIGSKDSTPCDPIKSLSDRELEVFHLIGQGKTAGAIARRLGLSVHTIDTYRAKIRHKLGMKDSVELMRRAVQWVMENP